MIELGFLKRGDLFEFKGNKYRIEHLIDRDINNVSCRNLLTNRIEHFDLATEVKREAESEDKE